MSFKSLFFFFFLKLASSAAAADADFTFNGFRGANLTADGTAAITADGLLRLTNTTKLLKGHAFYPNKICFKRSPTGKVLSFSTTFVFGIVSENSDLSGHGIILAVTPSKDLPQAIGTQYMGLLSPSNNGNSSNHIVAAELDTIQNPELGDINANHVGIDINSLRSNHSSPAGYFADENGEFKNLSLISGEPMQIWVEYDGTETQLNVTLSPMGMSKPGMPLLSSTIDLSDIIHDQMYVGFCSSSDPFLTSHYILGWSFKMNGVARPLNLSTLPSLPRRSTTTGKERKTLAIWLSLALVVVFLLGIIAGVVFVVRRRAKFSELIEDWELEYGPQRFSYKDLYRATDGFRDKDLLGAGGFGKVYRGIVPTSKIEVAVKRVSHDSRQGMKEFVAEIVSIGRLRHRNLVQLLGYCRRKGELLLVYEYMPNSSLDRLIFEQNSLVLDWNQRFRIIKGVASGLLYLHEEWEQVVVHRDIKASNVLLDGELNGKLGDFGLARLYDHGKDLHTTRVVGTMGYIAPELTRAGRANTFTDVFAFGVFLLEVVCGRRPVEPHAAAEEEVVLVDMVLASWTRGSIWESADQRLILGEGVTKGVELVLKLGLLCCDPLPAARPSMRRVMQIIDGDVPLPEFSSNYLNNSVLTLIRNEAFDECTLSYPTSSSVAVSLLSGAR